MKNKFRIELLKDVSLIGNTLKAGMVTTVSSDSDISGPHFNGALVKIDNYPYTKFLWHNEFKVLKKIS